MSGCHERQLIVIDPQRIVRYVRCHIVRDEAHERYGELSVTRVSPAVAECGDLLQRGRRCAKDHSRNAQRRKEAIEALENLAAVASHLKHLLLVRDLRRIAK